MKYVISGKRDTFQLYSKCNNLKIGIDVKYTNTRKIFNEITDVDTIVLLQGWWGRSWAKDALASILNVYPFIDIEYLDGPFGEKERKGISSQKSSVERFELLDFE